MSEMFGVLRRDQSASVDRLAAPRHLRRASTNRQGRTMVHARSLPGVLVRGRGRRTDPHPPGEHDPAAGQAAPQGPRSPPFRSPSCRPRPRSPPTCPDRNAAVVPAETGARRAAAWACACATCTTHDLRHTPSPPIERISGSTAVTRLFAGRADQQTTDTYNRAEKPSSAPPSPPGPDKFTTSRATCHTRS